MTYGHLWADYRDQLRAQRQPRYQVWESLYFFKHNIYVYVYFFNALTLLVGRQEENLACKKLIAGMFICLE